MDLQDLKTEYYFFNPTEFGKVFVLVDFGNVRPGQGLMARRKQI